MHSSLPQQLTNFRFAKSRVLRWVFQKVEDASDLRLRRRRHDLPGPPGSRRGDGRGGARGAHRERHGRRRRRAAVAIGGFCAPSLGHRSGGAARALHGNVRAVPGPRHAARRDGDPRAGRGRTRVSSWSAAGPSRWRRPVLTPQSPARRQSSPDTSRRGTSPRSSRRPTSSPSPRIAGTNTPLKIYSYLRAGKPIVATDLLTHTQVLDRSTALLVRPDAAAFAAALEGLLNDPARGASLARAAAERARTRYSREMYVSRTRLVCDRLTAAGLRARIPAVPPA